MAKVITFSRTFPSYHPKKGQPTYFVEAILTQLGIKYKTGNYYKWLIENNPEINEVFLMKFFDSLKRDVYPKSHTIRNHKKPLKVGDKVWSLDKFIKTGEGDCEITDITDDEYCIQTRYDKRYEDYKSLGLYSIENKLPSLFKSNPFIPEFPKMMEVSIGDGYWIKEIVHSVNGSSVNMPIITENGYYKFAREIQTKPKLSEILKEKGIDINNFENDL